MSFQSIQQSLGGVKVLHHTVNDESDLYELTSKGITKESLVSLSELMSESLYTLASKYLNLSYRSLQRRANDYIFDTRTSEQILRLSQLYTRGVEVFDGDADDFKMWLNTLSKPLGDIKPIEMLGNGFGIELVLEQLERMEYGIY